MKLLVASLAVLIARGSLAPEDQLGKEMTHDLEVNFNKIAPFGKEDTAKELQSPWIDGFFGWGWRQRRWF